MIKMEGMAPFNLIKGEMDVTLQEAEQALKRFMEDATDAPSLQFAMELLQQLLGVTRVIYLDGAAFLLQDMLLLADRILNSQLPADQQDNALGVLGQSFFVLTHYLNYIHLRQKKIPLLLVPTLNEIRRILGVNLVSEFDFAELSITHLQAIPDLFSRMPSDQVPIAEIPERCRRLRHMYQVGLLGIVRGDGSMTNLKIINRALERIARICGDVPIAPLWWVGLGAVQAFIIGDVQLSSARKIVMRKLDAQIKRLIYEGVSFLNQQPPQELLQECLYLLTLAQNKEGLIHDLKSAYGLLDYPLTDHELRQETLQMNGPGGSVIGSVAMSLQEELLKIKESLEIGASGMVADANHFADTEAILTRTTSTMLMLGLTEAGKALQEQQPLLQAWAQPDAQMQDADLQKMADALMQAENAIAHLKSHYTYDVIPKVSPTQANMSVSELDEARLLVVAESRVGLSMSKKAISTFLESGQRPEHIENVPDTLHSLVGALQMLELARAAAVLKGCQDFMQVCLSMEEEKQLGAREFEILADALSSIDYYLEGMEERKPIGEGVLDVAEESLSELGVLLAA